MITFFASGSLTVRVYLHAVVYCVPSLATHLHDLISISKNLNRKRFFLIRLLRPKVLFTRTEGCFFLKKNKIATFHFFFQMGRNKNKSNFRSSSPCFRGAADTHAERGRNSELRHCRAQRRPKTQCRTTTNGHRTHGLGTCLWTLFPLRARSSERCGS